MSKPGFRAGRDQATLTENVELLTGQRGNGLDRALTVRDAERLGMVQLRRLGSGVVPAPLPPGSESGVDRPHQPTGVTADGAFHTILVQWAKPDYRGHAYTEVWRAPVDNLAEAVMVGDTATNIYPDATGAAFAGWYWVRHINRNGVAGPFSSPGVQGQTSRNIDDILEELAGRVGESELTQHLLDVIGKIPLLEQASQELADAIEQAAIDTDAAIDQLRTSSEQADSLLAQAQELLGLAEIDHSIIQDQLNQRILKYQGDFESFRNAVFEVDPETGTIEMQAVDALRTETFTKFTEVDGRLDAVEGEISFKASQAQVDSQGGRLSEAELRLDGVDAALIQRVTQAEFETEQSKVTELTTRMDAAEGQIATKAAQSQVDNHGTRLATAESLIQVNADELAAQAIEVGQVRAEFEAADNTLIAAITQVDQARADGEQAAAQRLTALEVTQGDHSGRIVELEQVVSSDGATFVSRFEALEVNLGLTGGAAIDAALANAEADQQARLAAGFIRYEQQVQASALEVQGQTLEHLSATLGVAQADIVNLQQVVTTNEQSFAQQLSQLDAAYQAADQDLAASVQQVDQARADGETALAQQISQVQAELESADSELTARVQQAEQAQVDGDSALALQIDTVQSELDDTGAAVEQLSMAVTELDENGSAAHQALWSVRAQAGEVTAGIGLVAKSGGGTEAVIAAGQVSVFDPAQPLNKDNLFVIEGGNVYMNTAFIKQAYIEALVAAGITAERVNALNLNAVNISGGQIQIGNNFAVDSAGNLVAVNMTAHNTTLTGTLTAPNAIITEAMLANAIIGNAKIKNAAIDTLKVAGNAITIPIGSYAEAPLSYTSTLRSVSISSSGAPIQIIFAALCHIDTSSGSSSMTAKGHINLYENGALIWNGQVMRSGVTRTSYQGDNNTTFHIETSSAVVVALSRTPGVGTHTYSVTGAGSSGGTSYSNRYLGLMETKR